MKETDLDEYDVEETLIEIHELVAFDGGFNGIYDWFSEEGLIFDFNKSEKLIAILQGVINNTRTYYNCGYTPSEMGRIMKRRQNTGIIQTPKQNSTINSAKKRKIRPNEPCPCGSGKKYKNVAENQMDKNMEISKSD